MILDKDTLTVEQKDEIKAKLIEEITQRPPTIGVIGVSGVGKSSTLNALFKTNLEVSHVTACTKEFRTIPISSVLKNGEIKGHNTILNVVDAPGLGEDFRLDSKYLELYEQELKKCDVILWIVDARNRAIALDQMYLQRLKRFHQNMVFAINQVDLVEPVDWNDKINLPSLEQEKNIEIIKEDRREKITAVLDKPISIISYSVKKKYQLQELFTALLSACPIERAWIFSGLKTFTLADLYPKEILAAIDTQKRL